MTSGRKWNVDDVQRLVEAATNILDPSRAESNGYRCIGLESITADYLRDALVPFQPGPGSDLVEKIAVTLQQEAVHGRADYRDMARAALAAVRDHDAKAVAK